MISKNRIAVFAVLSLCVSGCSNLLYSDYRAPVYSSTQAKQSNQVSSGYTNSSASTVSPGTSMQVVSNSNDPYAASTPAQTSTVSGVAGNSAPGYVAGGTTVARAANGENPFMLDNGAQANTQAPAVSRPDGVVDNAQQQAQQAVQNATQTAAQKTTEVSNKATQKVAEKAQQAAVNVDTAGKASGPTGSATTSLIQEAHKAVADGNYDKAASALERAHRIEPGNAKILYDIAQIRFAQGKYSQAESFASKASGYAQNSGLSKKIWTLLANSRKALGNASAAKTAAAKAASL